MGPYALQLHEERKARLARFSDAALRAQQAKREIVPEKPPADVISLDIERRIRLAEQVAGGIVVRWESRRPPLLIQNILAITAEFYGLRVFDLISARRSLPIVRPRQVAMYLACTLTGRSLPEIGRRCGGRDHTTVIHSRNKIASLIKTNEALRNDVEVLTVLIMERFDSMPQVTREVARESDSSAPVVKDPRRTFWTERRVARLASLWADGMSSTKIADALGCSRGAVCGKVRKLGLPYRKVQP